MSDLASAYRQWREAPFPRGSTNEIVDELRADVALWDSIVAECVVPLVESGRDSPAAIDVAGGLAALRQRIEESAAGVSGEDLARLIEYRSYCVLMQDVYDAAQGQPPTQPRT